MRVRVIGPKGRFYTVERARVAGDGAFDYKLVSNQRSRRGHGLSVRVEADGTWSLNAVMQSLVHVSRPYRGALMVHRAYSVSYILRGGCARPHGQTLLSEQ
jgi:hypothetical protein